MRLVCPNCDAKYEVPDDAIPIEGRDVQCSNCGHAWFQHRPEDELAAEEEAALFGDDLAQPDEAVKPDGPQEPANDAPPLAPETPPTTAAPPADTEAAIASLLADTAADAASAPASAPKQELDESVLAVLREEAEREAEARRMEAQRDGSRRADAEGQMQVQPDLGVEGTPAATLSPTQRRLAMLKGKDPDAPAPEPARPPARRDLLPDVEEINSTLQPSDGSYDPDAEIDKLPDLTRGRSGFRSGFFLMLLLAVVAAAVYVAAPRLIEQFPGLESALTTYVAFIDTLRTWLNEVVDSATRALNGEGAGS